jgi:hypothetical protein
MILFARVNLQSVFEIKVLRSLFVPNSKKVTKKWERLHDEELNYLYSSHNIVRVTKSRSIRWERYEARVGEQERYIYLRIWWGNLKK